jgi:dihydrofolate synthase/folylpolyglutamate synthase
MVVETGLGGLMDGTNTITSPNQVVVITKLGLDHTAILGPNLKSIAFQKAGIIHSHNSVFSVKQLPQAKKVLDENASKNKAKVNYISPKINFKNIKFKNQTITYDFKFDDFNININKLCLNTFGLYQVENSALSLSVLKFLSTRDHFNLDINQVKNTFLNSHFFGRVDVYQKGDQTFILDGAHNPQKMRSLVSSLKKAYPHQKFVFIIAFKQRHDFPQMIKLIIPIAQKIILTSFNIQFQDMAQISQSASSIISLLNKLDFKNYQIALTPKSAYLIAKKTKQSTIITGSLYLLPKIYPYLISQ